MARVWPGSLGSRVENRALAQSSLAEDHRDLTECLTTEDVRRPLSPFDARFPVITAGGLAYVETCRPGFAEDGLPSGRTAGVPLSVPVLRPVQVGHTAEVALAVLVALDLRSCLLKFVEYRPN